MGKLPNSRQKFLDELAAKRQESGSDTTRCLNWNIRNPSLQRAMKQMNWLERNNFDVVILTEVKLSQGCAYIKDRLASLGYTTVFPRPENGDYGVILAVKKGFKEIPKISIDFLPYRVAFAVCNFSGNDVLIAGTYIPIWKNEKKKIFLKSFGKLISNEDLKKKFGNWIILGDMNILEPNHIPSHPLYKEYEFFYESFGKQNFVDAFRFFHPSKNEYSWFSRENNGYRFDHIFVSEKMSKILNDCFYIHDVRLQKLSDHSAMCAEISANQ
jgi:exodeoxyribonuclease-3